MGLHIGQNMNLRHHEYSTLYIIFKQRREELTKLKREIVEHSAEKKALKDLYDKHLEETENLRVALKARHAEKEKVTLNLVHQNLLCFHCASAHK